MHWVRVTDEDGECWVNIARAHTLQRFDDEDDELRTKIEWDNGEEQWVKETPESILGVTVLAAKKVPESVKMVAEDERPDWAKPAEV